MVPIKITAAFNVLEARVKASNSKLVKNQRDGAPDGANVKIAYDKVCTHRISCFHFVSLPNQAERDA